LTDVGDVVKFDFVYAPGAVGGLKPEMKMTAEDAKSFGILYGVCVVCGARLEDAESVAKGIGPVCLKKTVWRNA